jgi:drug/metabolite transporter (DMT)-like permease
MSTGQGYQEVYCPEWSGCKLPFVSWDFYYAGQSAGRVPMYIALEPAVALIAGILILIQPRLLNYIVAIYLILIGLLGLLHH